MRAVHYIFRAVLTLGIFALGVLVNANAQTWKPPHPVSEVQVNQLPFQCRPPAQYAARSIVCNGQPVIVYDLMLLRQYEPEMFLFLRVHEYGHIELRHIYNPPRFPNEELQMERAADCWAAQQLSQADPTVLDRIVNLMETKYANALGNLTHDNGRGVAATIRRCRSEVKPRVATEDDSASGNLSEVLSKFIKAGRNNFRTIKGGFLSEVGRERKYKSLLTLPGAMDCSVWVSDDGSASASCLMAAFDRLSEAKDNFQELVDDFKDALPEGWLASEENTSLAFERVVFRATNSDPRIVIDLDRNDALRSGQNRVRVRFRRPIGR
jgi:hypothetical protein